MRSGSEAGPASLLLFGVTNLWFETDKEDEFRVPGYAKERRVEPLVQIGLLTDASGLPFDPTLITEMTPMDHARMRQLEDENRQLRLENEFLKKGRGLLREDTGLSEKCALMSAEKANYPLAMMCRLLGVVRSTYYDWTRRGPSETGSTHLRV